VAVVALAVVVPLAAVLLRSVVVDGEASTEALVRILGSARTWRILGLTVGQAAVSSLAAAVVGIPVAYVLARYEFRGRTLVRSLATVPFVLPSVVIAAAFSTLLGPSGVVDLRGTWWAVIAAHVCFNLAVVVRLVGAAVAAVDPDLEAAAHLSGASTVAIHRRITLPLVGPAVSSALVIVFLFCLTSFGVIVVLGGGWVTTIEVEMWTRATRQFDLSGAAVLAGLQAVTVVVVLIVAGGHRSWSTSVASATPGGARPPVRAVERIAVAAAVAVVAVVAVLPLAVLVERSLQVGDGHGLANWVGLGSATAGTSLAVDPLASVGASLRTAVPAAAVAVLLGVPAAGAVAARPGGLTARILLLPLAVSATTVGLGLLLVSGSLPWNVGRSAMLVVVAQALVALPLVVRGVAPAFSAMPGEYLDAAALAGSSRRRTWWTVQVPIARPAIAAGGGLALIAALGEFGATVFVARRTSPTVPVAIERLLSRPGQSGFGQAMALSVLLGVLCAAVLWVVDSSAERGGTSWVRL
jgi:thiamine transport system permease protein